MYREATGIYTKAYGVVDERERHDGEQQRYRKQHNTYLSDVGVDAVNQVFLIFHLAHLWIGFKLARDKLERVGIGIVSIERNLYRRKKRVGVGKLTWVGAERLDALAQCLLFAYIVESADVRALLQLGTELSGLTRRHIVLKHQCHHNILFYVCREVARCKHREHNQAQQYKHHSRANAQRYRLQSMTTAGLFPSFCHFLKGILYQISCKITKKKSEQRAINHN